MQNLPAVVPHVALCLDQLGKTIGRDEKLMIVDKFFRINRLTS